MKSVKFFAFLAVSTPLLLACNGATHSNGSHTNTEGCMSFPNYSMPNPASDHCTQAGYQLEIRSDSTGEYGVCKFPDGSECEEWAFYRGQCGLERSACAQQGYSATTDGSSINCVYDDGTSCPEWDFSRGCCGPTN